MFTLWRSSCRWSVHFLLVEELLWEFFFTIMRLCAITVTFTVQKHCKMEQESDFRGKQKFNWRQIRICEAWKPDIEARNLSPPLLQLLCWRYFKERFNCVKYEDWKPARVTKCDLLRKCWFCKLKLSRGVLIYVSNFFKILNDAAFKTQGLFVTASSLYHRQRNIFVLYPRHWHFCTGKMMYHINIISYLPSPEIFQSYVCVRACVHVYIEGGSKVL